MRRFSLGALVLLAACGNDIQVADSTADPVIRFVDPVAATAFDPLAPVQICARVSGGRAPVDVSLASNEDGVLATGTDFGDECSGGNLAVAVRLTDAEHVLEISVTDALGRQASDRVTLTPAPNDAPGCEIIAPLDGAIVEVGAPVVFDAVVDDEDPAALALRLESDLDGELYAGGPTSEDGLLVTLPDLSPGDHRLRLTATDPRGVSGECRVEVRIEDCVDLDLDGFTTCDGDCDDGDDGVFPGVPEEPNGIDDDCDGATDEGTALADDDLDGFTELDGDCDDADPRLSPGAVETPDDGIDQDCDGDDTVTCSVDGDGDGFGGSATLLAADGDCSDAGESTTADDCDDGDARVSPGAFEVLNDGIDQDCTGTDEVGCFADGDRDGFGTPTILPSPDGDCNDPGETAVGGDCDDGNDDRYPGAAEIADDGIDQDCTGADTVRCRRDDDLDGFGVVTIVLAPDGDCVDPGESTSTTDCDDTDGATFPGATEIADDGVDQDCSGSDARTCQIDGDFDGFGTTSTLVSLDADCADPGESTRSTDCNDVLGTVFPGAPEVADDGVDQDCSGADTVTCRVDGDRDGYGSAAVALAADGDCLDLGESDVSTDCDDADAGRNPGELEIPGDGIDQDCTGADLVECWSDGDGDGFGDESAPTLPAADGDCLDAGESSVGGDCDDGDPAVSPVSADVWGDGVDADCDGIDGVDLDGDGYAAGFSGGPDCDDDDPDVNPGATESRNGADDDCDTRCDEGLIGAGDLVISELMINPDAVSDTTGEWFELYNPTGTDIALCAGWTFADLGVNAFTVADPTLVVPSGGRIVLGADPNPATNGGVSLDAAWGSGLMQLGNGGDELRMSFDGLLIDAVSWGTNFDPTGASMQTRAGLEDAASNDVEANWCAATSPLSGGDAGTPGDGPDC